MTQRLSDDQLTKALLQVPGWSCLDNGLMRRIDCKGFAPALTAANLAAAVSDRLNHHADIRLGWGYCELRWTSHDAGGLTPRDFAAAARFNAAFDGP